MTLPIFDLTGHTVLITGSTAGMGLAIARGYAAFGARTIISSNEQDDVDRALALLKEDGVAAEGIVCNLWEAESAASLAQRATEQFGTVDIVIAHGGGFVTTGPIADVSREDFEKILITGFVNGWDLIRGFLPGMAEAGGGSVVVTSSIAAQEASPMLGAYGTAKAALNGLVRSIAAEWGQKNVRANAIAPAMVRTSFSQQIWDDPDQERAIVAKLPIGRLAEPEDVVGAALLLGSPAGSYITGQVLLVDGGRSIS
ncbi:SDR family NAD(P)-dependent oxidoreductase [Streptomyces sp. NPDC003442]